MKQDTVRWDLFICGKQHILKNDIFTAVVHPPLHKDACLRSAESIMSGIDKTTFLDMLFRVGFQKLSKSYIQLY